MGAPASESESTYFQIPAPSIMTLGPCLYPVFVFSHNIITDLTGLLWGLEGNC